MQSLSAFFFFFFLKQKIVGFKSHIDMYFHSLIIEFFWFDYLEFQIKKKIHTMVVVMSLEEERVAGKWLTLGVWGLEGNYDL